MGRKKNCKSRDYMNFNIHDSKLAIHRTKLDDLAEMTDKNNPIYADCDEENDMKEREMDDLCDISDIGNSIYDIPNFDKEE